ncbi:MAG: APC family permease [Oscillospiraceae bacterium]|nr:APC family permease [Oscillospiraceae bacterium]
MQEKKLKLVDLVFIGMGGCIGAGIFSMLGVGIGLTGRSVCLAFILAQLFKMSQQTRVIVTSSMFSLSGGYYSQSVLILNPMLTGASAINNIVGALSFSVFGISLASYTALLIPALDPYQKLLSLFFMALFCVVAATGADLFSKVQNLLGISKVVALGLFIVFGFMVANHSGFEGEPFVMNGGISFITAVALMSFTCDGIPAVNYAPMCENAKRDIPRAWIIASIACGSLYAMLGYVGSSIAPYAEVANQNLGYLAQMVLPKALYIFFVIGGAMASLSTALLGGLGGYSQMYTGIAQDGWLPKFFRSQKNCLIFMFAISALPIVAGISLDNIVSMMMVPGMLLTFITDFRAMKMPEMFPEQWPNNAFNLKAGTFKALMVVSMIASALTGYFSLTSLTPGLMIGTVVMTIAIYVYASYMIKSGKIDITSTTDLG